MKKKIISFVLSIVLLIFCFVSFDGEQAITIAGAGDGESTPITNVTELKDVLEFIKHSMNSDSAEFVSLSNYLDDSDITSKSLNHTSATIKITTSITSNSSTSNPRLTSGLHSSESGMEREMTCYFTKNKALYVSEGMYYEKTVRDSNTDTGEQMVTKATAMNFNMEILITRSASFVNFRDFSYIDNDESRVIKTEYKNQWIEIPYVMAESLISVDNINRDVLGSFEEMFEFLWDTGRISHSDDVVSFDENDLVEMMEESEGSSIIDPKEYDIDFIIDLSNPNSSLISTKNKYNSTKEYNNNDSMYGNTPTGTITNKISTSNTFVIYNVDNTVVNWDSSSVKVSADNVDEFDRLFVISEFKEDN